MKVTHDLDRQLLIAELGGPHATLSWALARGGLRTARAVVWRQVRSKDLGPNIDAQAFVQDALEAAGYADCVGLLTSGDLARFEREHIQDGVWSAECVTTVGLSNAISVGDPPGPLRIPIGTINTLCRVSHTLTQEALLETLAIVVQARTAAVFAGNVRSQRSERAATGTGTDCVVVAAPEGDTPERFAGMHTPLGAVVGAAVREATARGVRKWIEKVGNA